MTTPLTTAVQKLIMRFARKPRERDYAVTIDKLQADRIWMASQFGYDLNHRACRLYTRTIRNLLYEMEDEDRQFLADGGPEYPLEKIR